MNIVQRPPPPDSLLQTHRGGAHPERWGRYGDCFSVHVSRPVTLAEFVFAFYTTWAFRLERGLLRLLLGAASTDRDAYALAQGTQDAFAVWRVGARTESQLLVCDRYEATRSWFQVESNAAGTTLQFGSALASAPRRAGRQSRSRGFRPLLGLHVLYSKLLLRAAAQRLLAQARDVRPT